MLIISLTSIPPRFAALGRTLESLLGQGADAVWLCLPRAYRRFDTFEVPPLPEGVQLVWPDVDHGPATKMISAVQLLRGRGARLIYCDDDWVYGAGWARALTDVPAPIVAASGFGVGRLKRQPEQTRGDVDIAQGFGGVAILPDDLDNAALIVPERGFAVDDIWLSGQYARLGLPIGLCPEARRLCEPRDLGFGLQDGLVFGRDRAASNLACVEELTGQFGIWRPLVS